MTRWRADPTPTGFVFEFEFEERWEHEGQEWYAREMMRAEVAGGQIAELTVYCTGDWDRARQAEHTHLGLAPPVALASGVRALLQ